MSGYKKKKSNNQVVTDAIVSDFKRRKPMSGRQKKIVVIAIIIVALGASIFALYAYVYRAPAVELSEGEAISTQVELLEKADQDKLIKARTSPSRNIDYAYAKALAYAAQNENRAAAKEYTKLVDSGKAKYYMYLSYALVQARQNKYDDAVKTAERALDKLKADKDVSTQVRADYTKQIKAKIDGFKDMASTNND